MSDTCDIIESGNLILHKQNEDEEQLLKNCQMRADKKWARLVEN